MGTARKRRYRIHLDRQPLAVLNIEDGALKIGGSESGRDLYAVYHKSVPMILRYEVPEIR